MKTPKQHSYIGTVEALRQRCVVDINTGCWNWQGATATDGTPRLHTLDHARIEKRTMSGPSAVWNIAHGAAPLPGHLVMRRCGNKLCLCPVHLRTVRNKAELGLHIRRAGWRVGTALEARRANQLIACTAAGHPPTAPEVVRAIRAAPQSTPAGELASQYGVARQTVSRIRRGESHRGVV